MAKSCSNQGQWVLVLLQFRATRLLWRGLDLVQERRRVGEETEVLVEEKEWRGKDGLR